MMWKQFGARPTKTDIQKYSRSAHWEKGRFINPEKTSSGINLRDFPQFFYQQFIRPNNRIPGKEIKIQNKPVRSLSADSPIRARWYGHSVLFLQIQSLNIFIDPMFGENAAPISPIPIKRFSRKTIDIPAILPAADLILISHDHYDHLDYQSILKLKKRARFFIVALGVKRHLVKWGVDPEKIKEMDWWETFTMKGIRITFTPTRHFSGRSLRNRTTSLWGGWALRTKKENIWYSGDGGYGNHFREIGQHLGPFDFGFMECGQYSPLWHPVHLFPEESIRAATEAKVRKIMPVHWAGFALAQHSWTDPVLQFIHAAEKKGIDFILPEPGEEFELSSGMREHWWIKYE